MCRPQDSINEVSSILRGKAEELKKLLRVGEDDNNFMKIYCLRKSIKNLIKTRSILRKILKDRENKIEKDLLTVKQKIIKYYKEYKYLEQGVPSELI